MVYLYLIFIINETLVIWIQEWLWAFLLTAAAQIQRESDVDREDSKRLEQAQGERTDRLLATLEAQQKASGEQQKTAGEQQKAAGEQQKAAGERIDRLLAALEVQQKASEEQQKASEEQQKAAGERMDRLLAALEVQQTHTQQVLDTLITTAGLTSMLPDAAVTI